MTEAMIINPAKLGDATRQLDTAVNGPSDLPVGNGAVREVDTDYGIGGRQANYFDASSRLVEMIRYDATGFETLHQYNDAQGNRVTDTFSNDGSYQINHFQAANGLTTVDVYDSQGREAQYNIIRSDGSKTYIYFNVETGDAKEIVSFKDGHRESDTTYVTGKNYASQTVFFDPSGKVTETLRQADDGSSVFDDKVDAQGHHTTTTWNADGTYDVASITQSSSREVDHYNAAGEMLRSVLSSTDGFQIRATYDPDTGLETNHEWVNPDGSKMSVTYHPDKSYYFQYNYYDTSGRLTGIIREDTGEHVVFSAGYGADGSSSSASYDSIGRTTSETHGSADHSRTVTINQYMDQDDAAPSTTLTEHYDVNSKLLDRETVRSNGANQLEAFAAGITITAPAARSTILVGSPLGNDTFRFGEQVGKSTLSNFIAGDAANHDTLDLHAAGITSFADVQSHASSANGGTMLTLSNTDTLFLKGVDPHSLTANDFIFH